MAHYHSGINLKDFPRLTGETDDLPRFQRAVDWLTNGGRLYIPPNNYTFQFRPNSTVHDPTRVLITNNNTEIIGIGKPTIHMQGLTTEYLLGQDDYLASGRDIFTCFSFAGIDGCRITNLRITGEYTTHTPFRYQSPRAIGVSFKGATNSIADNLDGANLHGNLFQAVNSYIETDAPFAYTDNVHILNSRATHCWENGFNYMGGTRNSIATNLTATNNQANGLETACQNFILNGGSFIGNQASGLAISGTNMTINDAIATGNLYPNNPGKGYGVVITGGENIQINGGKYNNNQSFGIYLFPGVKNIYINNPEIRGNAEQAANKVSVWIVGTDTNRIENVDINGGLMQTDNGVVGGIVRYADNVSIRNMLGSIDGAYAFTFYPENTESKALYNYFDKPINMNDPTGLVVA